MTTSRYIRSPRLDLGAQFGTSQVIPLVRAAIKNGNIPVKTITLRGSERLDTLAGVLYGDSRYWWVLAIASNIGWGLQVPTDTVINVPDLATIINFVSSVS
jgi:hypothetical protein